MAKLQSVGAVFATFVMGGAAFAQDVVPINERNVVGNWALLITPAERDGLEINVDFEDGDLPLTITRQTRGTLTCVLRGDPAPCRIDRGKLVITMPTRSGGARMTFTLTERTHAGFSGAARVSVRFLPVGGHIGTVTMTPR